MLPYEIGLTLPLLGFAWWLVNEHGGERFITISLGGVNREMVILFSMYKLKIEGQVRNSFVAFLGLHFHPKVWRKFWVRVECDESFSLFIFSCFFFLCSYQSILINCIHCLCYLCPC